MKYKVGDKVRVRKDLKQGEKYAAMYFTEEMRDARGSVLTIESLTPCSYTVKETYPPYWTDEMFEGLAEETPIKFRVGDRVRRIHCDNSWADGTKLKVGEIVTVVKINSKDDISVDINGKIKAGNDPKYFELVNEESIPEPTPVININVTINHYDNACWYCRKGGLVDLYLDGAMGICPNCKRVCNDIRRSCPVDIERKPSKRKNEPLTTEELYQMDGKLVWCSSLHGGCTERFNNDYCGWFEINVTEERISHVDNDTAYPFKVNGVEYGFRAYIEEPEQAKVPKPECELPF